MTNSQLLTLLEEAGLSPETFSRSVGLSNMTIRRWLAKKPGTPFPARYVEAIQGGVCRLASEGKLGAHSAAVNDALSGRALPLHEATLAAMGMSMDTRGLSGKADEHALLAGLSKIGSDSGRREYVDKRWKAVRAFTEKGMDWKKRIGVLKRAATSSKVGFSGKFIAYGSLFYLLFVPDLIPDCLPVFGLMDDFVILGIAANFFMSKGSFGKLNA